MKTMVKIFRDFSLSLSWNICFIFSTRVCCCFLAFPRITLSFAAYLIIEYQAFFLRGSIQITQRWVHHGCIDGIFFVFFFSRDGVMQHKMVLKINSSAKCSWKQLKKLSNQQLKGNNRLKSKWLLLQPTALLPFKPFAYINYVPVSI